jgi:DNA (cytosine-5)-methyltransferase 1
MVMNKKNIPTVVSLFSGAGGFDTGLKQNGFHIIWANERNKVACLTYKANHPETELIEGDIKKVRDFPKSDVVIGGYPCQGFSVAGKRLITDGRNQMYKEFKRCLIKTKPRFFIAENVKGLLTIGKGEVINLMVKEFEEVGYTINTYLTDAKNYGVPQSRERVFIIGVRKDIDFTYTFPPPTHGENKLPYVTLKNAIGSLSVHDIGEWDTSGFSSRYLSRNRKKSWDDVSFTIQASGRHAPLHPSGDPMIKMGRDEWVLPTTSEHRKLSYYECSLIQTFPQDYIWKGKTNEKYVQVGNAVPCQLAKVISQPIYEYLSS